MNHGWQSESIDGLKGGCRADVTGTCGGFAGTLCRIFAMPLVLEYAALCLMLPAFALWGGAAAAVVLPGDPHVSKP